MGSMCAIFIARTFHARDNDTYRNQTGEHFQLCLNAANTVEHALWSSPDRNSALKAWLLCHIDFIKVLAIFTNGLWVQTLTVSVLRLLSKFFDNGGAHHAGGRCWTHRGGRMQGVHRRSLAIAAGGSSKGKSAGRVLGARGFAEEKASLFVPESEYKENNAVPNLQSFPKEYLSSPFLRIVSKQICILERNGWHLVFSWCLVAFWRARP